jgi:hypothetical protein
MDQDTPIDLFFSDEELATLLSPQLAPAPDPGDVVPSEELLDVSRRIAAPYVDLIEAFAGGLIQRRPSSGMAGQLIHAMEALHRLAEASGDALASGVVEELLVDLRQFAHHAQHRRAIDRMATRMRAWIPRFAALLQGGARDRMLSLVSFRGKALPLFQELSAIEGIGPRRLERLYCAGLYTVDAVLGADPLEIAAVTGLPPALARRVVDATVAWNAEQRLRSVRELQARATEVLLAFRAGEQDPEVLTLARDALLALQAALATQTPSVEQS